MDIGYSIITTNDDDDDDDNQDILHCNEYDVNGVDKEPSAIN